MAEIKIDGKLFHERITHFTNAWKNDNLRNRDNDDGGVFRNATSILIMMGKVEQIPELHKNNAMHVSGSQGAPSAPVLDWHNYMLLFADGLLLQ